MTQFAHHVVAVQPAATRILVDFRSERRAPALRVIWSALMFSTGGSTSVPAMVAYLVGMIALLTGFLALGAEHLYRGATALFIAVVSVALGSLWVLGRLIQHPHPSHHGARH